MWPFRPKAQPEPAPEPSNKPRPEHLRHSIPEPEYPTITLTTPPTGIAQDSAPHQRKFGMGRKENMPNLVGDWYASQGFIGHYQSAWIAKNWLVDKAINMPARDALRQGWALESDHIETFEAEDKKHKVEYRLHELVVSARRSGGAVAILLTCPPGEDEEDYYAAPLNIEAVTHYQGIAVVDAADAIGEPLTSDLVNPASLMYMTPTFFRVGLRRYHMSHCVSVTPYPVADALKPTYQYWGASLPERIYERVYAAERSASEAPLLLMTKRLRSMGVDMESILLSEDAMHTLYHNVEALRTLADNMGVFVYDSSNGGGLHQLDTGLTDVDQVIMTQYQLVAAIAEIPATKLLGTTPKGFNATGEAEAEDYRQHLESIQTHDMQPLLEKHYRIVAHMEGIEEPGIVWEPLDSPTAEEFADIDAKNGQTVAALVAQGVVSPMQGAEILSQQKDSMFYGIDVVRMEEEDIEVTGLLDAVMAELDEQDDEGHA